MIAQLRQDIAEGRDLNHETILFGSGQGSRGQTKKQNNCQDRAKRTHVQPPFQV